MLNVAMEAFPKTKIFMTEIDHSDQLPIKHQENLKVLNQRILYSLKVTPIPKLDPALFQIAPNDQDKIHWTTSTANAMLQHWMCHI
jgi:hypothetical protein